nr:MAG TPA: hypothetical protein [Caudoviricetes sp.]
MTYQQIFCNRAFDERSRKEDDAERHERVYLHAGGGQAL